MFTCCRLCLYDIVCLKTLYRLRFFVIHQSNSVPNPILIPSFIISICFFFQVTIKPPLPKWITAESSKKSTSRQKHSVDKINLPNQPSKSSLRKSNSEGNIDLCGLDSHSSATSNPSKKSVTFSQHVLNQDHQVGSSSPSSFKLTTRDNIDGENSSEQTQKSCLCSPPSGVVVQNGLEVKEIELERREMPETTAFDKASKVGHTQRTNQSTRAKVLAKMKEIPGQDEEPCPCRIVTRPTAALLTASRSGKSGTTDTSSRNEKILVGIDALLDIFSVCILFDLQL